MRISGDLVPGADRWMLLVGGRSEGAGTPGQKQRMSSDPASTSKASRGGFKTHRLVTLPWVHGPLETVDRLAGPLKLDRGR